jgi:ABC-type dipeptide/oligopeptide/nickel transport system permease subunit
MGGVAGYYGGTIDSVLMRLTEILERPPTIDAAECFLTSLFLRRYIAYCARQRRYAHMHGAGRLFREITVAFDALA